MQRMNAKAYVSFLSKLPNVPCREDLAEFATQFFYQTGNAVEVGVYQGDFALHNVLHWKGQYYAIDAWAYRKDDHFDKNFKNENINMANMNMTQRKLQKHENRVHIIKNLSTSAAKTFENESFDWIYIDALHTEQALSSDLQAWWPKLRNGGLMSGDDYGDKDASITKFSRFSKIRHTTGIARYTNWGVIRALMTFARKQEIIVHTTWMRGTTKELHSSVDKNACYRFPAWYFVKP